MYKFVNTVPKVRLRCHPSCLGVWVTSCISSRNTSSACVKMVCIGARQLLQLQTTKANQLIISGTRFFGKNLGISFTGNLCCRQSARLVHQTLGTVTFCDIQPRSASDTPLSMCFGLELMDRYMKVIRGSCLIWK